MNARFEVGLGHAGQVVRLKIQGNPTLGYYDDRIDALKDIYNFNASKASVLDSDWFNEQVEEAIALETAGESEAAETLFNKLMNAAQLTIGIINRDGTKMQFTSNQVVDVLIGTAETEDKDGDGNVLGTYHTSVIAESVSPVQAKILTKRRRYGADIEEEEQAAEEVKSPAAKVAKA
jgi:hypothetical protein